MLRNDQPYHALGDTALLSEMHNGVRIITANVDQQPRIIFLEFFRTKGVSRVGVMASSVQYQYIDILFVRVGLCGILC